MLGPFPQGYHIGALQAIMVIMISMEPKTGRGRKVKYGTTRKNHSTGTILWDVSQQSGAGIVLSSSRKTGRYIATCNPSKGQFYQMFSSGCSARSGDIIKQDRAFTLEVLNALLAMYETEYKELEDAMALNLICSCMVLLLTCLGGMWGYEAVWIDLATLRYNLLYCKSLDDFLAVAWPFVGRFKAHGGFMGCYMIPIAGVTNLGIKFFVWTQQFANKISKGERVDGWDFLQPD